MVKLMDNTVIHEVYNSVKQAFFTVMRQVCCHVFMEVLPQLVMAVLGLGYYWIFISDG